MKKSNAQAERHSNRAGLLRASRPRTDIFEQNDLASSVVRYVFHDHFFYFLIDYKHKHTAVASELHVPHLLNSIFFYFLIDYKHKHTATGVASHVSHVHFFLFF